MPRDTPTAADAYHGKQAAGGGEAPLRKDNVIFLDRSKASRVEVLEYAVDLEQAEQLSEILMVVRDTLGNYSFVGATDEVVQDPARVIGQLEMLKQAILQQAFS